MEQTCDHGQHAQHEQTLANFTERFCRFGVTVGLENFSVSGLMEQLDGQSRYAVQFRPHDGRTTYLLKLIHCPGCGCSTFGLTIISGNRVIQPGEKDTALLDFAERTFDVCVIMMAELMKNQQPGWFEPRLLN